MQNRSNRIPQDVVLEIISHLGQPLVYHISNGLRPTVDAVRLHTLRSLASVCREYHHHVLPFLFEAIHVCPNLQSAPDDPIRFGTRFCRSICGGNKRAQTLAAHVKIHIIEASAPFQTVADMDPVFSGKIVPFFSSLRELHFLSLPITNDFLAGVVSLPQPLEVLRIEEYSVPEPFDESLLHKFSTLSVTHIYDSLDEDDEATIRPQQFLRHYPISHTKYLTSRSRTDFHFLDALASSQSPMDHLECVKLKILECNRSNPEALIKFLKRTPALKSLHIEEIQYDTENPMLRLPPSTPYPTMVCLQHLHAHLPALEAMIPGSSVSSIGIAKENITPGHETPPRLYHGNGPSFWRPYAEAFTKSLKNIVSMDVPIEFYASIHFVEYFPDLRRLIIRPKYWNWCLVDTAPQRSVLGHKPDFTPDEMIAAFLAAQDSHPDLTDLQFHCEHDQFDLASTTVRIDDRGRVVCAISVPFNREASENALLDLRQAIPSLESVAFMNKNPNTNRMYRFSYQ